MALQTKTITTEHYNTMPYVALTVREDSTSIPNNTSGMSYDVVLHVPGTYSPTATKTITWTVGSESGSWSGKLTGGTNYTMTIKSGVTYNQAHDTNGTKTISLACSFTLNTSWAGTSYTTLYGSGTMTLTAIPRYGTSVQSLASKTETSITMNWSSDSTVDYIWYSSNNGSSWTGLDVTDGTSGSYTISGLSANTAYNVKTRIRRKDSQLTTDSSALSVTTYSYPYASSMPNFTIGDALTVGFYNPLGRTMSVYLIANGVDIANNPWTISGTSYKGFNADSTISQLYATIPNAKSATYKIKVVYGSSTIEKTGGTYSVNTSASSPTVSGLTYFDTNSTSTGITGDNQQIVQNISTVRYTASGVSVKNSATLFSVKVSVNGNTYTLSASGSNYVGGNAVINSGNNVTATVTVTDSRGLTGTKSVTVQMVAYSNPNAIITLKRKNNFYAETTLNVDANWTYVGSNAVAITYQARQSGTSTWTESGTAQDNVPVTLTLDNQYAWDFQIVLVDSLGGRTTYNTSVKRGMPLVFFDRLRNSVGFEAIPEKINELRSVLQFRSVNCDAGHSMVIQKDGTQTEKHAYFTAHRSDTNYAVSFGINPSGRVRGIYDGSASNANGLHDWLICADANDVIKIGGDLPIRQLSTACPTGLDNIIAFAKSHRPSQSGYSEDTNRVFCFHVDGALSGGVSDDIFDTANCTVFAKFSSDTHGWVMCLSDRMYVPWAMAVVSGGTTYGWYTPFATEKTQTFTAMDKTWTFRKVGKTVHVVANGDCSSASQGWTTIGTLDADMRPAYSVTIPVANRTTSDFKYVSIADTGLVRAYNHVAITGPSNWSACGSYEANVAYTNGH